MTALAQPSEIQPDIHQVLEDPAGVLLTTTAKLFAFAPDGLIGEQLEQLLGEDKSLFRRSTGRVLTVSRTVPGVLTYLAESYQAGREHRRRADTVRIVNAYQLRRPTVGLADNEKVLVGAMAALKQDERISEEDWQWFLCRLIWAGGNCDFALDETLANHTLEPLARKTTHQVLSNWLDPHQTFLKDIAQFVSNASDPATKSGSQIAQLLSQGATWMSDSALAHNQTYSFEDGPAALVIGHHPTSQAPVFYHGHESLITIAPPGTAKTQSQVIPNLLRYKGSAIVLDVKGELWDQTSGWRAKHIGPVFRFSPTDDTGASHTYNPFDFISRDAEQASVDCELLANQLISRNPNLKDPYWENRARDFVWAFAMLIAVTPGDKKRNLATLMAYLSLPVNFEDGAESDAFLESETMAAVQRLLAMAKIYDIPQLAQAAQAIRAGLGSSRLESVFDSARNYLSIFARSKRLTNAMAHSSWHPLDLRENIGTTLYITLPGDDIDAYMPVVRVILQQHANILLRDQTFAPDVPPVTFFLDEMPQLGHLSTLVRLLDVGRGAGLRLWLFAQYMGQLRDLYANRADGLINACRVRCFMRPDNTAAEFLQPQLGQTRHMFSGHQKPLAETHDLMGPAFADTIIVTAHGEAPLKLSKQLAFEHCAHSIKIPPPEVPRV